jgi:hypothetical protein
MEDIMKQARLSRISAPWILLALALGLALLTFTGCTMVGDSLNGVRLGAGPTSCVKECNDFYAAEYDREQKLHQTNVEGCQSQSQPAKGECLVSEDARHQAAKDALGDAKIECQNNCHRQGSGSAG